MYPNKSLISIPVKIFGKKFIIHIGYLQDFQQHAAADRMNTADLIHYFKVRYIEASLHFPGFSLD